MASGAGFYMVGFGKYGLVLVFWLFVDEVVLIIRCGMQQGSFKLLDLRGPRKRMSILHVVQDRL